MDDEDDAIVGETPEVEDEGYDSLQDFLKRRADELQERNDRNMDSARKVGHSPVLLQTAMQFMFPAGCLAEGSSSSSSSGDPLAPGALPKFDGNFVDCTFGRGGHTRAALERLTTGGRLWGFDIDPAAAVVARGLEKEDSRFTFMPRPFGDLAEVLAGTPVHGVLMDLGVSSPQLDNKSRGFSMQRLEEMAGNRPLDLRMNPTAGMSASEWLAGTSVEELAWVLRSYSSTDDSPILSERVAQAIMDEQERSGPYTSMRTFADTIVKARASYDGLSADDEMPMRGSDHPARLTVQALRLFLNGEYEQLDLGLAGAFQVLEQGGRCVVGSFKRKEVEIIREFVMRHEEPDAETRKQLRTSRRLRELYPLVGTDLDYSVRLVGQVRPSGAEVAANRRSRSGHMFVLEKAPRTIKQVRAKPRLERNRFKEPDRLPLLATAAGAVGSRPD